MDLALDPSLPLPPPQTREQRYGGKGVRPVSLVPAEWAAATLNLLCLPPSPSEFHSFGFSPFSLNLPY